MQTNCLLQAVSELLMEDKKTGHIAQQLHQSHTNINIAPPMAFNATADL
jgi:hypothetical protein